jgi:lipid A 3-O-deacylase
MGYSHTRLTTALGATTLCSALCFGVPGAARAAETLNIQVGAWEGYRNFAVGLDTAPVWSHVGRSREELVPEFGAGYSDYAGHVLTSRNSLWHFGGAMFFRWYVAPTSYLEVGTGPNLFTRSLIGNHVLSTNLQFGDSVGFAHRFTEKWTLGVRYTHFSNAAIKRPDDGANFVHFVVTYDL